MTKHTTTPDPKFRAGESVVFTPADSKARMGQIHSGYWLNGSWWYFVSEGGDEYRLPEDQLRRFATPGEVPAYLNYFNATPAPEPETRKLSEEDLRECFIKFFDAIRGRS